MTSTIDLSKYRVLERDAYYVPDFITAEEEEYLIRKIVESPQPQWRKLANRRLQTWGGEITSKGVLIAQPLPPFMKKSPDIISRIRSTGIFDSSPHNGPNHIIMNEYLPGQGIMPHEDGPQYHPVVATISLGSHTIFHYYKYQEDNDEFDSASRGHGKSINKTPVMSVLLEPRSLIISLGSMYSSHLHGIDEVEVDIVKSEENPMGMEIANLESLQDKETRRTIDCGRPLSRGVRYSLTFRDVEHVFEINSKLLVRH